MIIVTCTFTHAVLTVKQRSPCISWYFLTRFLPVINQRLFITIFRVVFYGWSTHWRLLHPLQIPNPLLAHTCSTVSLFSSIIKSWGWKKAGRDQVSEVAIYIQLLTVLQSKRVDFNTVVLQCFRCNLHTCTCTCISSYTMYHSTWYQVRSVDGLL